MVNTPVRLKRLFKKNPLKNLWGSGDKTRGKKTKRSMGPEGEGNRYNREDYFQGSPS